MRDQQHLSELQESVCRDIAVLDDIYENCFHDELNRADFCWHLHRAISDTIGIVLEQEGDGDEYDEDDMQTTFYLRLNKCDTDRCSGCIPNWVYDNEDEILRYGRYGVNMLNDIPMYDLPEALDGHIIELFSFEKNFAKDVMYF